MILTAVCEIAISVDFASYRLLYIHEKLTDAELLDDSNSPLINYKHRRLIKDSWERTLIALFGLEKSSQSRGWRILAQCHAELGTTYSLLVAQTSCVFGNVLQTKLGDTRDPRKLQTWIQKIALYATRYPHATKRSQHGFPDKMMKLYCLKQRQPWSTERMRLSQSSEVGWTQASKAGKMRHRSSLERVEHGMCSSSYSQDSTRGNTAMPILMAKTFSLFFKLEHFFSSICALGQ